MDERSRTVAERISAIDETAYKLSREAKERQFAFDELKEQRMVKMKNAAWGSGYLGDQRLIYGIVDKYHPRDKTFRIWFAPPYRTGEIWVSRDMLLGK